MTSDSRQQRNQHHEFLQHPSMHSIPVPVIRYPELQCEDPLSAPPQRVHPRPLTHNRPNLTTSTSKQNSVPSTAMTRMNEKSAPVARKPSGLFGGKFNLFRKKQDPIHVESKPSPHVSSTSMVSSQDKDALSVANWLENFISEGKARPSHSTDGKHHGKQVAHGNSNNGTSQLAPSIERDSRRQSRTLQRSNSLALLSSPEISPWSVQPLLPTSSTNTKEQAHGSRRLTPSVVSGSSLSLGETSSHTGSFSHPTPPNSSRGTSKEVPADFDSYENPLLARERESWLRNGWARVPEGSDSLLHVLSLNDTTVAETSNSSRFGSVMSMGPWKRSSERSRAPSEGSEDDIVGHYFADSPSREPVPAPTRPKLKRSTSAWNLKTDSCATNCQAAIPVNPFKGKGPVTNKPVAPLRQAFLNPTLPASHEQKRSTPTTTNSARKRFSWEESDTDCGSQSESSKATTMASSSTESSPPLSLGQEGATFRKYEENILEPRALISPQPMAPLSTGGTPKQLFRGSDDEDILATLFKGVNMNEVPNHTVSSAMVGQHQKYLPQRGAIVSSKPTIPNPPPTAPVAIPVVIDSTEGNYDHETFAYYQQRKVNAEDSRSQHKSLARSIFLRRRNSRSQATQPYFEEVAPQTSQGQEARRARTITQGETKA